MEIVATKAPPAELEADALILALSAGAETPAPWEAVDAALDGIVSSGLAGPAFQGKTGQSLVLPTYGRGRVQQIVLVGLGAADNASPETWRRAVAHGCTAARDHGAADLAVPIPQVADHQSAELVGAAAEAALLASYRFQEYKKPPADQVDIQKLTIATSAAEADEAIGRAQTVAEATCWARDLVNRPGNAKRTTVLADLAVEMAKDRGLDHEVLDTERCAELGMNALLAVGGGSEAAPRVVILEHRPQAKSPPVVLVGKGITFDSGGMSIKPAKNMGDMKADMAGAAAVLATLRAAADLGVDRHVVGVAPLAENLPSATAYRPGDIVRAFGEQTIEVINTDAEGRLILADALAYSSKRFEPAFMVDLATLTGACVIALGSAAAGLMGNDDDLCEQLRQAGEDTGERLWQLPMWKTYDKIIDSDVANVKNSGGREASVITAAKFLQRFVGDTDWAHLDIAGTAFISKATPYQPKGATGFGVRLLTRWLQQT